MRQARSFSGVHSSGGAIGPHSLPLARIKKIMKRSGNGRDVTMISGEAPAVFAKACELFMEELTVRSWRGALEGKKRVIHKEDIAAAVAVTDVFDFLESTVSGCSDDQTTEENKDVVDGNGNGR